MNYKKTYTPKNGYTPLCEIGKCSLKDLEFGILELSDGQSYTYETKDREVAFIILGGKANFTANGKDTAWWAHAATCSKTPRPSASMHPATAP